MSGKLSVETLEAIIEALPVHLSFIDAKDRVGYYSHDTQRKFRATDVVGRDVLACHAEKIQARVTKIISDLKSGKPEVMLVSTDAAGHKKCFRFFPVKDKAGKYIGAIEVIQDVTDLECKVSAPPA